MTETELMLTSLLQCERIDLYVDPQSLSVEHQQKLQEFKIRRAQGEPLQYILGNCEFMGFPLQVDGRVLIPRPETEILIESVLKRVSFKNQHSDILDIGTGSGNIAISLAKFLENAWITAIDFSKGCLDLATLNAKMNDIGERIQFIESNLFSSFHREHFHQRFDILVSNPPYIPTSDMDRLPLQVQWEPRLALDGGSDGLEFYRWIFKECAQYLKANALIFLEIGCDQSEALKEILEKYPFLRLLEVQKDLCLKNRVLVVQFEGRNRTKILS